MLSRRSFLAASGGALVALSVRAEVKSPVPTMLDHVLLGCSDLQAGIDFVEKHTGVRAAFGGAHPGRGTHNALLSLGERQYLEIIAPDPRQKAPDVSAMVPRAAVPLLNELESLTTPRLIGWAAHPGSLVDFAKRLRAAGIAFEGPTPGSRKRPDGQLLQWQTLDLKDDASGLLPFFIEWSADSPHPSADAPTGCRLARFELAAPDPDSVKRTLAQLSLDAPITREDRPQLRARIVGPVGQFEVVS